MRIRNITLFIVGLLWSPSIALAQLHVVTTTTDLAAIARAVGGDDVRAESLTSGTTDLHYVAARPSMIRRAHDADLLLVIGVDLEVGWLPAVLGSARNPRINVGQTGYLDLSTVVPVLGVPTGPVSRAMGDVHASGNPHYLLDPENGRLVARAIAKRLARLDPANAPGYDQRLAEFEIGLNEKLPVWNERMARLAAKPVIAYHTSLIYLANAYGFEIVDEVEPLPGIAPSPKDLGELVATIRAQGVRVLLMEPFFERRSATFLHDKTGIEAVVIPSSVESLPGIQTYFDLFDGIVGAIGQAGAV